MQFFVVSLFALFTAAMAAPLDVAGAGGLQTRQTGPSVQEAAMRNDEEGAVVKFSNPGAEAEAAA